MADFADDNGMQGFYANHEPADMPGTEGPFGSPSPPSTPDTPSAGSRHGATMGQTAKSSPMVQVKQEQKDQDPGIVQPALPSPKPPVAASPGNRNVDDDSDEGQLVVTDVLDPRGDLIIQVPPQNGTGALHAFQVCSRTLYRASPYVERQYNREASPVRNASSAAVINTAARKIPKKITIPGLSPRALGIVMLVIHGKVTKVFQDLDDRELLGEVLVVTHHLEMDACLAPVAAKWMRRVYEPDAIRYDVLGPQLWITHQLGHLACLRRTAANMVISSRVNMDGELIGYGAKDSQPFVEYPPLQYMPVFDQILQCRATVINSLINMVNQALARLTHAPTIHPFSVSADPAVCAASSNQTRCDCTMLGAFLRALVAANWTYTVPNGPNSSNSNVKLRPPVEDTRGSARQLYRKIRTVRQNAVRMAGNTAAHNLCDPFGKDKFVPLEAVVERAVQSCIELHEDEFRVRARMMGFEKMDEF